MVALSGLTLAAPTWAAPIVRASTDRALNPPWGSAEIGVAGFAVSAAAGRPVPATVAKARASTATPDAARVAMVDMTFPSSSRRIDS